MWDVPYLDLTSEIKSAEQPPLVVVHGTEDYISPYVAGENIYNRAQEVGLKSHLITMEGAHHVAWNYLFRYRYDLLESLVDVLDLENSEPYRECW